MHDGELADKEIEIEVTETETPGSGLDIPGMPGGSISMVSIGDIFGKAFGGRKKKRRMTVTESYDILIAEESDSLIDEDKMRREAIHAVEQSGIVFLDEIDKVCSRNDQRGDVSREGVNVIFFLLLRVVL